MCGITGIIDPRPKKGSIKFQNEIRQMAMLISHRGPDGTSTISNLENTAFLGMNTLLIVNPFGEKGPYRSDCGRVMLTFNGEIYNFRELAKKWGIALAGKQTDAHIIVAGYLKYGISFVNHLSGMFAIGIFDNETKKAYLARDRMGEKPLFYSLENGVLKFASEIRCLTQAVKPLNDRFLTFEAVIGEETLYNQVSSILPGQLLEFDLKEKQVSKTNYWRISRGITVSFKGCDLETKNYFHLLDKAIKNCTPSQPFGLMLSSGLDSSILAIKMKPKYVFTVAYPGMERYDEVNVASQIAQKIKAKHIIIRPTPEDLKVHFETIIAALEYPTGNSSIFSEYMLYKKASELGLKTIISGIGPDEILLGYIRHSLILSQDLDNAPRAYAPLIKMFQSRINSKMTSSEKYYELIRRGPHSKMSKKVVDELFHLSTDIGQSITLTDLNISFPSLLQTTDRLSSGFGIEVRAPYLDHELVQAGYNLPQHLKFEEPNKSKLVLREYAKSIGVFKGIISNYDKIGFSTPINQWLNSSLKDWYMEKTKNTKKLSIIKKLCEQRNERGDYDRAKSQILAISLWLNQHRN